MANKSALMKHVDRAIIALDGLEAWQQAAIVLLATKSEHKMSYEEIAKEIGVAPVTLYRFRQRPDVKDYLLKYNMARIIDSIPDVMDAQVKKAIKSSDTKAAELIVKYAGLLVERRAIDADVHADLANVTDKRVEDLEAELRELRAKQNKIGAE